MKTKFSCVANDLVATVILTDYAQLVAQQARILAETVGEKNRILALADKLREIAPIPINVKFEVEIFGLAAVRTRILVTPENYDADSLKAYAEWAKQFEGTDFDPWVVPARIKTPRLGAHPRESEGILVLEHTKRP